MTDKAEKKAEKAEKPKKAAPKKETKPKAETKAKVSEAPKAKVYTKREVAKEDVKFRQCKATFANLPPEYICQDGLYAGYSYEYLDKKGFKY